MSAGVLWHFVLCFAFTFVTLCWRSLSITTKRKKKQIAKKILTIYDFGITLLSMTCYWQSNKNTLEKVSNVNDFNLERKDLGFGINLFS